MPTSKLILVRHCEATGQEPEAPLTNVGAQQAQTLADFLLGYPIDRITTSEYLRARQSMEPFASISDLTVHTDARLNERVLSAEPIKNWQDVVRDSFDDDHDLRAPRSLDAVSRNTRQFDSASCGESARKVFGSRVGCAG